MNRAMKGQQRDTDGVEEKGHSCPSDTDSVQYSEM